MPGSATTQILATTARDASGGWLAALSLAAIGLSANVLAGQAARRHNSRTNRYASVSAVLIGSAGAWIIDAPVVTGSIWTVDMIACLCRPDRTVSPRAQS